MKAEENATISYSRIPNRVLEWLYGPEHDLTLRQVKILLLAFRCTYGFNRRSAPLSSRFVSLQTGIDQADCVRTLRGLVDAGLLSVSCTRKTFLYTILPRRYKNKQNHWHDDIDDGGSPSRWCFTIGDDGDSPSDIERKEKGENALSEHEAGLWSLGEDGNAAGDDPGLDEEPGDDQRPLDDPAALLDAFRKALKRLPETRSAREAYLEALGMDETECAALEKLLPTISTCGGDECGASTGGIPPSTLSDPIFDLVN